MAGFNRVIIMGNLTRDPELRYTPSGTAVTDLRLAVTTKKKTGDETLFVDVTVWERQAETCCEFLTKGKPVLVEGRLKMDEWNDRDSGQKRSKLSVVAQAVQFLGGAGGDRAAGGAENSVPSGAQSAGRPSMENLDSDFNASDDVPF